MKHLILSTLLALTAVAAPLPPKFTGHYAVILSPLRCHADGANQRLAGDFHVDENGYLIGGIYYFDGAFAGQMAGMADLATGAFRAMTTNHLNRTGLAVEGRLSFRATGSGSYRGSFPAGRLMIFKERF